jgi:mono/diheme cytochrome c family protein
MNCKTQILPTLLAALAAGSLHAADVSHGKSLQQENCMRCHDDAMYTRDNRKVTSLGGLQKQVMRCEQSLGLQWFDDDVADVTQYLNATYYHYK